MQNPLQVYLEKLSGRIAVSDAARKTIVEHLGGDAVVDSQRGPRRQVRRCRAAAGLAGGARRDRLRRPARRVAQGAAVLLDALARDPARAGRGCGCWSPARASSTPPCPTGVTVLGRVSRSRQGAGLRRGRCLRRAEHRRRELRHRAARGDGRRHADRGQRPRRVPTGARGRPARRPDAGRRPGRRWPRRVDAAARRTRPSYAPASTAARQAVARYDWSVVTRRDPARLRDGDRRVDRAGRRGAGRSSTSTRCSARTCKAGNRRRVTRPGSLLRAGDRWLIIALVPAASRRSGSTGCTRGSTPRRPRSTPSCSDAAPTAAVFAARVPLAPELALALSTRRPTPRRSHGLGPRPGGRRERAVAGAG